MAKRSEKQRYEKILENLKSENSLGWAGLLLKRASKNWGAYKAAYCEDEEITYSDLYHKSEVFAHHLSKLGVKENSIVILYYQNSIEFYIGYHAIWRLGAIVAPLNIFLTENEVNHIVKDAEPAVIIAEPKFMHLIPKEILDKTPVIDDIKKISESEPEAGVSLPELENKNIEDTAAILYTSGTTGMPKGVMLSSKNIIYNTAQAMARFQFTAQDKVLCPLPLFHSFPQNVCLWTTTLIGASAIIIPKVSRSALHRSLKHKPTAIVAVPALYGLFCLLRNLNFSSVNYFFSGGDAITDKTRSYFEQIYRRKICNGYGLTETSPFISVFINDYSAQTSNIGRPFSDIEAQIRDNDLKPLKQGKIGVLWVKGPNIMKGYYNAEKATSEVIQDGWFNTGDLAYINRQGEIVISGREKDLIISKGVNIYPQEIENTLLRHQDVLQAGVIGVKDHDGEKPVAFIASNTDNPKALIADLEKFVEKRLAAYKVPREYIVKKELPLTSTGKIDKKKLRKEVEQELARS